MKRSTDRILASHAGVLPRTEAFQKLFTGLPGTEAEFEAALPAAVKGDRPVAGRLWHGRAVGTTERFRRSAASLPFTSGGRMDGVEQRSWPGTPPKREAGQRSRPPELPEVLRDRAWSQWIQRDCRHERREPGTSSSLP